MLEMPSLSLKGQSTIDHQLHRRVGRKHARFRKQRDGDGRRPGAARARGDTPRDRSLTQKWFLRAARRGGSLLPTQAPAVSSQRKPRATAPPTKPHAPHQTGPGRGASVAGGRDAADGRARRRRAPEAAPGTAAVRRSAPQLRPAPSGQALRPVPAPAEVGGHGRGGREGRRRRQGRPAAGVAPVAVAGAGGGGEAGRRGRQQRGPRGAARAGLGGALGAPPVGDDAGGRELRAQGGRRSRRRGARGGRGGGWRWGRRPAPGGRRVVGGAGGVRRPRPRQPPALKTEINHP